MSEATEAGRRGSRVGQLCPGPGWPTRGDEFGVCVDQHGVPWMVNISQPQA